VPSPPPPVPEGGDGQQQAGEQHREPGEKVVSSHDNHGGDRTLASLDSNSMNV
jgi:hypothetical protein